MLDIDSDDSDDDDEELQHYKKLHENLKNQRFKEKIGSDIEDEEDGKILKQMTTLCL